MFKIPPKIKVLEALSAIGDKRIKLNGDKAIVLSSEKDKEYKVYYYPEKNAAWSTDNGTRFRKYVGYPIISFLMLKGVLPFNKKFANALKGIKWKEINDKFKRDYDKTMEYAYNIANKKGVDIKKLKEFVDETIKKLKDLKLKFPHEN